MLHLIINQIRDKCKLLLHVWCLDDETIIRGLEKVAKAHGIIRDTVPRLGLELNIVRLRSFGFRAMVVNFIGDELFSLDIGS